MTLGTNELKLSIEWIVDMIHGSAKQKRNEKKKLEKLQKDSQESRILG